MAVISVGEANGKTSYCLINHFTVGGLPYDDSIRFKLFTSKTAINSEMASKAMVPSYVVDFKLALFAYFFAFAVLD